MNDDFQRILDLITLERHYTEMYEVLQKYQKAFAWLHKQQWFADNNHKLHAFMKKNKVEFPKEEVLPPSEYVEVQCTKCGDTTLRHKHQIKNVECFDCKRRRHNARSRLQKR